MRLTFYSLQILVLVVLGAFANEDPWKLAKEKDGIRIYYKRLPELGKKGRAIRIEFMASTTSQKLLMAIKSEEHKKEWMENLKSHIILKDTEHTWTSLQVFKFPWPFENRFAQIKHDIKDMHQNRLLVVSHSQPEANPSGEYKAKAMKYFTTTWDAQYIERRDKLRIRYESSSHAKPILPRWIQDRIIQKTMFKSFKALRSLLEEE